MPENFEAKIEVIERRLTHLEVTLNEHLLEDKAKLEEITHKLDALLQIVYKYKGFFGGLLFAASSIGAAITILLQYLGK